MKGKLFFFATYCVIFLVSCSAQEDYGSLSYETGKLVNDDTIAKPVDVNSTIVVNNPIVAKNIVVAHRGAWKKKNLPQNSIASLREAIRLECKGSEFDILLTADDSLVINHDDKYNNRVIQNSKYSDLVTLKLSNGEKLPTLREYILAAKQNNTTTLLFCEFKNYGLSVARRNVFIEKTLELVNKLDAQQLMVYISFDYDLLKQIRSLDNSANIQYLNGNITPDQLKKDNISGVDYYGDVYKNHLEWIDSAKKNSLELNTWTINDSYSINWFIKNNFDAITTDEPELALSFLPH